MTERTFILAEGSFGKKKQRGNSSKICPFDLGVQFEVSNLCRVSKLVGFVDYCNAVVLKLSRLWNSLPDRSISRNLNAIFELAI